MVAWRTMQTHLMHLLMKNGDMTVGCEQNALAALLENQMSVDLVMKLTAPLIVIMVLFSSCVLFGCLWNQKIVENPYLKKKDSHKSLFKCMSCFYLFSFFPASSSHTAAQTFRLLRVFMLAQTTSPFSPNFRRNIKFCQECTTFPGNSYFPLYFKHPNQRLDFGMLLGNN